MFLSNLIEGYILDCKSRGLSLKTIEQIYKPQLNQLCDFLSNPQIENIGITDLRKFIVHTQNRHPFSVGKSMHHESEKPLSDWVIVAYVRTLKTFFKWACSEGLLSSDISANLKRPKTPQGRKEIFSEDEIRVLLEKSKENSFRDYAIVITFLDSGIRKNELINLTLEDVNLLTGMILVRFGKGGKSREVCVGKVCRKTLWLYVNEYRKPKNDNETSLFLCVDGSPLSYHGLGIMMHRLSEKCGFRVFCHKFRHTYATALARKFPNAFLIAQVLGHSDLTTSRAYIHLARSDVKELFSPVDELTK